MKKYFLFLATSFAILLLPGVIYGATDLKTSGNGHYIEKSNGTPFLWLGDLDWIINMKYSDADIDALLADRQTNGFTVIAAAPAARWGSADYKDYYGNSPYINDDVTQFNSVYWNRWRNIADMCASRGLYLALIYGQPGLGDYPWYADTDTKRYEYGRKIGDTFKDKTNVIFINSEDYDGNKGVGVDGWRTMAEGVADGFSGVNNYNGSADYSTTFMSFHPDGSSGVSTNSSSAWFHTDSWLDANGIQTWVYNSEIYGAVNGDYNKTSPVKPAIMLEAAFEAYDYSPYIYPHDIRIEAWHTYFAGGAGYTYGHGYSFQQGYSVYDYINSVGVQHLKVLKNFMNAREWWKFVPDQGIISSGIDSGTSRKVAVRSTDGDECYVYYPIIASASIKMNCITTSSNVDATWFDPRNGNTQSVGTYTTSQTISLTPPSSWEDAVLSLKAGSAAPYCGDSSCNGTETCSTCPSDCGACPSTNPIAWWKFDEGSGTTAQDSSGNGNTGTLINGPVWATGKIGNALSFDGVNDYVILSSPAAGNNAAYTICSWWISDSTRGTIYTEGKLGYSGSYLYLRPNENVAGDIEFGTGDDPQTGTSYISTVDIGLDNSQWHFVCAVSYSKSSRELFVDGTSKGTNTNSLGTYTPNFARIGGGLNDVGEYFKGKIDDVRIYNRALSQSEIQTLYNAGTTDTTPPAAPTGVKVI